MKNKRKLTILLCLFLVVILVIIGVILWGGKDEAASGKDKTSQTYTDGLEENVGNIAENSQQEGTEITDNDDDSVDSQDTIVAEEEGPQQQPVIVEKKEASYERWLAAGMVTAMSMRYPDFVINGIYLASETELENLSQSNGAYIMFSNSGMEMVLHGKPLQEERTEAGTIDLYTADLGFATFDEVDNNVSIDSLQKIEMEELSELISQSMLVSIYEH